MHLTTQHLPLQRRVFVPQCNDRNVHRRFPLVIDLAQQQRIRPPVQCSHKFQLVHTGVRLCVQGTTWNGFASVPFRVVQQRDHQRFVIALEALVLGPLESVGVAAGRHTRERRRHIRPQQITRVPVGRGVGDEAEGGVGVGQREVGWGGGLVCVV